MNKVGFFTPIRYEQKLLPNIFMKELRIIFILAVNLHLLSRHYLDLSSEQHRVTMLFRGHQHGFQHLMHEEKVIATTLPVGMDSNPGYQKQFSQPDRAYIIKPARKVNDWQKRALLREPGHAKTDEVTAEFPLTSSDI